MQCVKNKNKPVQWALLFMALLGGFLLSACDSQNQAPPPHQMPHVAFVTIQPEKVILSTELPGRTAAFKVAEIRPQVNGLIQQCLFIEGAEIETGKVLYQIEAAPFETALNTAKAALKRAEASLPSVRSRAERYHDLLATQVLSQQDYDDAAAALNQVEADIQYWKAARQTARINLGYTKVTAPISGRIGRTSVTVGAIVTAYQPAPMATIQQLDPIYVDMQQSTTDLLRWRKHLQDGRLQKGAEHNKVKLILEDATEYPLEGTLQFSDVSVDPTTGSVTLRALFANPEGVLLPGMFVNAVIQEGFNDQAILVPQQGVARNPSGHPYALVVDAESKAVLRPLTLDRAIGNKWLVSDGLKAGDQVIVEGQLLLRPGTTVEASPFQADATPPHTAQPPAAAK